MVFVKRWLLSVMIALNQTANAVTGGDPYESVSSRMGHSRAQGNHLAKGACAVFEFFDFHPRSRADHCTMSMALHQERLERALRGEHPR